MSNNSLRLIEALQASLLELPMWRSFLQALCDILPCAHASLLFGVVGADQHERGESHANDAGAPLTAALLASGRLADVEPGVPVLRDLPGGTSATASARALILGCSNGRGRGGVLVLWRGAADSEYGAEELRTVRALARSLDLGLMNYARQVEMQRRQLVLGAALESSGIGVVLVDEAGSVLLTNAIADRIIATSDGLRSVGGRLQAETPGETVMLLNHISRKTAEQSAETNWNLFLPIALSRRGEMLPLTLIARPGPAFYPLKEPSRRTAMLILRNPRAKPAIPPDTLARLFGLTAAEAVLASALAAGDSLDIISHQLGVSRNTVRSQLQAVFLKTGTKRQGELVQVLLSSAAISS